MKPKLRQSKSLALGVVQELVDEMKFVFKLKDPWYFILKIIQKEPCTRPLLVIVTIKIFTDHNSEISLNPELY